MKVCVDVLTTQAHAGVERQPLFLYITVTSTIPNYPLHRCKGLDDRSNGSSQAQAWTAIDDLPTRQSNWAASLNQLPHTSLHKSATIWQSLTPFPSSNDHASKTGKLFIRCEPAILVRHSFSYIVPEVFELPLLLTCASYSLKTNRAHSHTLCRLTYVIICVLATTVHGVPAFTASGRSSMPTSLLS